MLYFNARDAKLIFGIFLFRHVTGKNTARLFSGEIGKSRFSAVVKKDAHNALLSGAEKRWDRSERHDAGGKQRLAKQGIEQRALPAFELTKHGKMETLLIQPLLQFAKPRRQILESVAQILAELSRLAQQLSSLHRAAASARGP
jgi:hypothetical protein